jgi:hypothetical protein
MQCLIHRENDEFKILRILPEKMDIENRSGE